MKSYLFYPGCSMDASAQEYKGAMLAVFRALGAEVKEIEDWTCCGASVAPVMSDLLGMALPARNLALAEKAGNGRTMVVGCSACFTSFARTNQAIVDPVTLARVNQALEVENLSYGGTVTVRHMLDILANDFGVAAIAAQVKRPLTGLKVAPYYGCQTVRPYASFDDGQHPWSMASILEALGATVYHHLQEATCCGTALLTTKPELGLRIAGSILEASLPADCLATVCPMCHMNLDSYQDKVSRVLGKPIKIPVTFLPQLIGIAFGLPEKEMQFKRHVVPVEPALARIPA
jgi:heterodisulfide reductase subunit B